MKIGIYISELLFDHENVILPGFGMFSTEYIPARFIPEEKKVESPSKIISFNHNIKEGETPLVDHISQRETMDKKLVWKFISDFVEQMHESLNAGNKVELQNVGVFNIDADNRINFAPDHSINYLSDVSGLSSVKEPEKPNKGNDYLPPLEEKTRVKETVQEASEPEEYHPEVLPAQELPEYSEASGTVYPEDDNSRTQLPGALKWIAYTVVPLLIIIIIIGFNFRYFFGDGGIFRSSEKPAVTQQVATPQPETTTTPQEVEEPTEVVAEQQPGEVDPMAEPPRPETGRPVYYIITGSFENHHQAQAFAEDLRRDGAPLAGIYMQTPAGFYRVAYGYYYDLEQAEAQLQMVQKQVNSNAWILHR